MIIKNNININHLNLKPAQKVNSKPESENAKSFQDILSKSINKTNEIKFSKHAINRLEQRNINLTDNQKDKINESVEKLKSKGVKESLVLVDNIALIVNVRNNIVVTALDGSEIDDNVFTNIDGAIISKTNT